MGHNRNSLKGLYRGLYEVPDITLIKGDTWSLDYNSNRQPSLHIDLP